MKVKVIKVKGKNLKTGDLFSNVGELYWNEDNILEADIYKIEYIGDKK